jgi:hypothetical protein
MFTLSTLDASTAARPTGRFVRPFEPFRDNVGSAAYARGDGDGVCWTVQGTGATFHAGILIANAGFFPRAFEDCMGADPRAFFASDAGVFVVGKGGDLVKITKCFHGLPHNQNAETIQATTPATTARAWAGMDCFISFSTPDGEVNGVLPVKFMAR